MKLLIIAPHYNYFIKDQVEALAGQLSQIYVAINYNPLTELSTFIPFSDKFQHFQKFSKNYIADYTKIPENVEIKLLPLLYFIPDGSNKSIGDKLYEKLIKWIQREKLEFDFIHAHFTWPCGYSAAKLSKTLNKPSIITIHENGEWLNNELQSNDEKIRWTWSNVNAIIRVNQIDINSLKIFNKQTYSIPNGFSNTFSLIDKKIARKQLNISINSKIIFSLGNLIKRKGLNFLIDSIYQIRNNNKFNEEILCFIGGSGEEFTNLNKQIISLNLENSIKLLNYIPNNEIHLWMNAADFFVLPSLNEGNPTVMFEALGSGLPFIGTRVGGVPEIIISEDYGLLVEPGNSDDLAEKINIALSKEWNREKISRYAEQFTWERIAGQILEIYGEKLIKL